MSKSEALRSVLFNHLRKSLSAAGISTTREDALICPLCWQEVRYAELSLEHIVPKAVGGRKMTLTCTGCNSGHGGRVDSHLSKFQQGRDALQGYGKLKTTLDINGHRLAANLKWGEGQKTFNVVGKATNPAASEGSFQEFVAGNVESLNCTIDFGCSKNRFRTAVIRSAYLVLFKCFGYEYARHEIVQVIRRRIADPSQPYPRLASLVIEARGFNAPYDAQHYVVQGNVNAVPFFMVFIRVRGRTTTHVGAFMPIPCDRDDEFFDLMERCSNEHNGQTLHFPIASAFS